MINNFFTDWNFKSPELYSDKTLFRAIFFEFLLSIVYVVNFIYKFQGYLTLFRTSQEFSYLCYNFGIKF